MLQKKLSILFVIIMFILSAVFLVPHEKSYKVTEVISPASFVLEDKVFTFEDLDCFDKSFTAKNSKLAQKLGITEKEAFILGNLGKYYAENLMKGRRVFLKNNNDIIYFKYSYRTKFLYSGFCLKNSEPYSKDAFEKKLKEIRRANYKLLDLDNGDIYEIDSLNAENIKHYVLMRKSHLPKTGKIFASKDSKIKVKPIRQAYDAGDIKIFFSDLTTKLKPDRNCSTFICKEILNGINNSKTSIDIAIYGYSKVSAIENALKAAISRGVDVRLVYDSDLKGNNIYQDTAEIVKLIPKNKSDKFSADAANIMHNKFYIFDDRILIAGSANLSHTDMSGFNTNSIVVINSAEAAKVYKKEFEQMFSGKFHTAKQSNPSDELVLGKTSLMFYFSPQDKSITNAVLPLIRNSKKYIYIPTFVLTEKRVTDELIRAKQRGVDVRIIIDALNASVKHSKHQILRENGVPVKTENYAGKMHSKSMIVDDEYTIIGSMNFSYSGENKNDENLIVIKDKDIAKFYKTFFLYQWDRIDNKWLKYNARAEGKDSIGSCSDGIDNNYDGLIDMQDAACR